MLLVFKDLSMVKHLNFIIGKEYHLQIKYKGVHVILQNKEDGKESKLKMTFHF